jgi:hypothetical protein
MTSSFWSLLEQKASFHSIAIKKRYFTIKAAPRVNPGLPIVVIVQDRDNGQLRIVFDRNHTIAVKFEKGMNPIH